MGTTAEQIDSVIDEMISRIKNNITDLGGDSSTSVIEGDEEPKLVRTFPSIFIIPLIESGDKITTKIGGGQRFHEFSITIVGIYRKNTVSEFMRDCRDYGFTCADLFSDENQKVSGTSGNAFLLDPVVHPAYHRVADKIVHTWSVKLSAKLVTF
jgi:hypothetical protein